MPLTRKSKHVMRAAAQVADLRSKIDKMFAGVHINTTEDRAVLHVALRAPREQVSTLFRAPRTSFFAPRPRSMHC